MSGPIHQAVQGTRKPWQDLLQLDGIREAGSQPSVEEGAALDDFKGVLCLGTIRPGPVGETPEPLLPGPHDAGLSANLADEAALPGLHPELLGAVDSRLPAGGSLAYALPSEL